MRILPVNRIFYAVLLLFAAACILQPVMADNGTITIAYRGSGGSYIGETVVFDGRNTYGNTTLIKISGLGLPPEGVPVTNLNGAAGGSVTGCPARHASNRRTPAVRAPTHATSRCSRCRWTSCSAWPAPPPG